MNQKLTNLFLSLIILITYFGWYYIVRPWLFEKKKTKMSKIISKNQNSFQIASRLVFVNFGIR